VLRRCAPSLSKRPCTCQQRQTWKLKALVKIGGPLARLARFADLDDQVEACRRVFASDTAWTLVRGSDLEEGESQGLRVWSRHVGDPILESNLSRFAKLIRKLVARLCARGGLRDRVTARGRPGCASTTATRRSSAAHASSGNHTPSRISSRPDSSFASRQARISVGVTRRYT
jgi:hypothetical protein